MKCPHCGGQNSDVVDSRNTSSAIRRRRKCHQCDMRWTTFEAPEEVFAIAKINLSTGRTGRIRKMMESMMKELDCAHREEIQIIEMGAVLERFYLDARGGKSQKRTTGGSL